MEKINLPHNAQGNIVWITATKGVVLGYTAGNNNPVRYYIDLWLTNDAGQTWTKVWKNPGTIMHGRVLATNPLGYTDNQPVLAMAPNGDLYSHRFGIAVVHYKQGVDYWNPSGHIIAGFPDNVTTGAIAFAYGQNNFAIIVEEGGRYWEFTSNRLPHFTKTLRLTNQNIDQYRWVRAGAVLNNQVYWVYLNRHLANNQWSIRLAQVGKGPIPIQIIETLPAGEGEKIGAVSLTVTPDGRMHLVYTHMTNKEIRYKVRTGNTWSPTKVIGHYTGHSVNSTTQTSSTTGTSGYQKEANNQPYLILQNDGFGLSVTFAEINEPPSAGTNNRTVNIKNLFFDGTNWSDIRAVESGIPLYRNTSGNETMFQLLGPFTTDNFGINSVSVRNGFGEGSLYFYPLQNEYQPYAPKNLIPNSGEASEDLTRELSWTFSDPVPGDTQSAYQVEIYRQSDSELIWDSGKVISPESTINIPSNAGLVYGINYQWRVRTWDQNDQAGQYSPMGLFKTSAKPIADITYPAVDELLNTDAPLIQWNYTDPEGLEQTSIRIRIKTTDTDALVYDTDWIAHTSQSFNIPSQILPNEQEFILELEVQDSDGIISDVATTTFSIEFVAPPAPSVLATVDHVGSVFLDITAGNPANDAWQENYYKVYRRGPYDENFILVNPRIDIVSRRLLDFESTSGWYPGGVGITPVLVEAKEGTYALGFGSSGAGIARYTAYGAAVEVDKTDTVQLWIKVLNKSLLTNIRVKFGISDSSYYYFDVPAEELTDGEWVSFQERIDGLNILGVPARDFITYEAIEIQGITGAMPNNNVQVDSMRVFQSTYTYHDPTTEIGKEYTYGVSAFSEYTNLESPMIQTPPQKARFTDPMINIQLVPLEYPELDVIGFMDGSKPPSWSNITETKYYQTKGSMKPTVLINGMQQYREGSVEIRFFDEKFGGGGLEAAESLENIKNFKPILLRTWWGRNYYISVDGEVDIVRKPGIGWFASFNFTEINYDEPA